LPQKASNGIRRRKSKDLSGWMGESPAGLNVDVDPRGRFFTILSGELRRKRKSKFLDNESGPRKIRGRSAQKKTRGVHFWVQVRGPGGGKGSSRCFFLKKPIEERVGLKSFWDIRPKKTGKGPEARQELLIGTLGGSVGLKHISSHRRAGGLAHELIRGKNPERRAS